MADISVEEIRKSFGDYEALDSISARFGDGKFTVLVGPSGCGKTTLLRLIAGLEVPTSGRVLMDGIVQNSLPPKKRDIAMVFQNYALYPHLTVARNLAFALKFRGVSRDHIEKRVGEVARMLQIDQLLDRYPRQLSGGQRQRVAMGRAIVRSPRAFLFDEPLSNLDAQLRVQMRTEIKDLHQRLETTSLYVTHDQVEAMTLGDMLIVMNNGLIEQEGPPLEVYDRPATIFVAKFIGSPTINLFDGSVVDQDGSLAFRSTAGLTIELAADFSRHAGAPAVLGIRPEHVELGAGDLDMTIRAIEPMGSETVVIGTVLDQAVTALTSERIRLSAKDTVKVRFREEFAHVFDKRSANRLD